MSKPVIVDVPVAGSRFFEAYDEQGFVLTPEGKLFYKDGANYEYLPDSFLFQYFDGEEWRLGVFKKEIDGILYFEYDSSIYDRMDDVYNLKPAADYMEEDLKEHWKDAKYIMTFANGPEGGYFIDSDGSTYDVRRSWFERFAPKKTDDIVVLMLARDKDGINKHCCVKAVDGVYFFVDDDVEQEQWKKEREFKFAVFQMKFRIPKHIKEHIYLYLHK